jgi:pilus assembly protein CpaF
VWINRAPKFFKLEHFLTETDWSIMSQALENISLALRDQVIRSNKIESSTLNDLIDMEFESRQSSVDLVEELEVRRLAENKFYGLGKLQPLIDDPTIEEIWINAPNQIFVARNGVNIHSSVVMTTAEVASAVERMLRASGRRLDKSSPFVDASLPDGSRVHVVIPDITRLHWSVNIRKFPTSVYSLDDLVALGSVSSSQRDFLHTAIRSKANILVSGATQAGKTTFLCALLAALDADERLISVEETFEIRSTLKDWVALQTRQPNLEGIGEVNLRRLIKEALRMRPSRLVVGEVREAEALDLLIALNSGLPGLCTIHANSADDAILKLSTLPLLSGQNIPSNFIQSTIASCVDYVVHCQLDSAGKRTVEHISAVLPFDGSLRTEVVPC